MKKIIAGMLYSLILLLFVSNIISAQTYLFDRIPKESIQFGLRFMHPSFSEDFGLSTFSGIYDVFVNVPVYERWSVSASIPYITSQYEEFESESGLGNIYVGAQNKKKIDKRKTTVWSLGFYLPTASEDIGFMGFVTHPVEPFKYQADVMTFSANYAFFNTFDSGLRLGLEVGPDMSFPWTVDAGDIDFYLHYGVTAGFLSEHFMINAELMGLVIATEEADELSDRFVHSVNFGGSYVSERITPGIFYKLLLKESLSNLVDGVIGINIDVALD